MFILNQKKNIPLTAKDILELKCWAKKCDLDIKGILFLRNSGLSRNDNQACFLPQYKNTVYIASDADIADIIDEIAHELKHREQRLRDGFFRYSMIMTFRRSVYEMEAYAEEDRIDMVKRGI